MLTLNEVNQQKDEQHVLDELEYYCSTQLDDYYCEKSELVELMRFSELSLER